MKPFLSENVFLEVGYLLRIAQSSKVGLVSKDFSPDLPLSEAIGDRPYMRHLSLGLLHITRYP
jgi:hypothetical protein